MKIPRLKKLFIMFSDIVNINVAVLIAILLYYGTDDFLKLVSNVLLNLVVLTGIKLLIYKYFQLYDSVWEFASDEELLRILMAVTISSVGGIVYLELFDVEFALSVYVYIYLFELALAITIRFGYRLYRKYRNRHQLLQHDYNNILIIGTGATACLIAAEIKNHPSVHGKIIGFIDDEKEMYNKTLSGIKVIGNYKDIYGIVNRYNIDKIIIALPTINGKELKNVVAECNRSDAVVRIIPGVREFIDGQVTLDKLQNISINNLVEMNEVDVDNHKLRSNYEGKTVLITGAGSVIGTEIARELAECNLAKLILTDIYENAVYDLQMELSRKNNMCELDVMICSLNELGNLEHIISSYRPDIILHTDIYRNQCVVDKSRMMVVQNNLFGTLNLLNLSAKYEIEKFAFVSCDRNINPSSVLGLIKQITEMSVQQFDRKYDKTIFSIVRLAEVVNTDRSVIMAIKEQISKGGPVTIPHKEVIRRYVLGKSGAKYILTATMEAKGGEIFAMELGKPIKIYDLAEKLIYLSGYRLDEDIEIEITGLAQGEKIRMDYSNSNEKFEDTAYKNLKVSDFSYDSIVDYSTVNSIYKAITLADKSKLDKIINSILDNNEERKEKETAIMNIHAGIST